MKWTVVLLAIVWSTGASADRLHRNDPIRVTVEDPALRAGVTNEPPRVFVRFSFAPLASDEAETVVQVPASPYASMGTNIELPNDVRDMRVAIVDADGRELSESYAMHFYHGDCHLEPANAAVIEEGTKPRQIRPVVVADVHLQSFGHRNDMFARWSFRCSGLIWGDANALPEPGNPLVRRVLVFVALPFLLGFLGFIGVSALRRRHRRA